MVTTSHKWPETRRCPINSNHKMKLDYSTGLIACMDCPKLEMIEGYFRQFSYLRCPYCGNEYNESHVIEVNKDYIELMHGDCSYASVKVERNEC